MLVLYFRTVPTFLGTTHVEFDWDDKRPSDVHRGKSSYFSLAPPPTESVTSSLKDQLHELQDEPFVFFCKQADTYVINKAILYVR